MDALAIFCVALAAGAYWAICAQERSRDIDEHIRRFFDLERDR